MFRFIVILLASVLLISVLRAIIGVVMKGFADLMGGGSTNQPAQRQRPEVPLGGELKRDPICGTYVSAATSIKKTANGQVIHFCSAACRDKYKV